MRLIDMTYDRMDAVQCSAVQCSVDGSVGQCSAVQCSVDGSVVQCSAVQWRQGDSMIQHNVTGRQASWLD